MVEKTEVQRGDKVPSKFIYISDKTGQECVCSSHQHQTGIHVEVLGLSNTLNNSPPPLHLF